MTKINTLVGAHANVIDRALYCWGDSLTESTSGAVPLGQRWPMVLAAKFTPQRTAFNGGIGGETATQVAARQVPYPCANVINTFWVGRNGVLYDPQDPILVPLAQMRATVVDDRFVVVSIIPYANGAEPVGSAARNTILAANASLLAAYPNNYLDVVTLLDDPSTRGDGLHLNAYGQALFAQAMYGFISAKGW